jgi:hypothetical protein
VRCLLVGFNFSGSGDPKLQADGRMLSTFYMGRLDAHVPKLDLGALIVKEATDMTTSDFASEAVRCGNSFAEKGREIRRLIRESAEHAQTAPKPSE